MKNVYFIPSLKTLRSWVFRAGFKNIKFIATRKTDLKEQRKTSWIDSFSLENFLNPKDSTKTIEGYPAPLRVYVRVE